MSDIGLFPPGALVWLVALAWCGLCLVALLVSLLIAWARTRSGSAPFARDRFFGYAVGAWGSGMAAGVTICLINWSGSLGNFARWLDARGASAFWLGLIVAIGPVTTLIWNRIRRQKASA